MDCAKSASSSSSGFVSISISDDLITSASSSSMEPASQELLRSVAQFELLELALSKRDIFAARRANDRIKEMGTRHNVLF